MYIFFLFYIILIKEPKITLGKISYTYFAILLISFSLITIKLTTAPLVIFSVFFFLFNFKSFKIKHFVLTIVIGLLIALPWFTRNIIMSGYLVYPLYSIDLFNVDWKMPITYPMFDNDSKGYLLSAMAEKENIHAWAKVGQLHWKEVMQMSISDWVPLWWASQSIYIKLVLFLVILSPLMIGVSFIKNKKMIQKYKTLILFWSCCGLNCVYWFLTAPDPRFVYSLLFITAVTGLTFFFRGFTPKILYFMFHTQIKNYLILFIALFWIANVFRLIQKDTIDFDKDFIITPKKPQVYKLIERRTNSGVDILWANTGVHLNPSERQLCGNAPVPCTPFFNPYLRMRGEAIEDGFYVDKNDIK
jgi:hypothetical protein